MPERPSCRRYTAGGASAAWPPSPWRGSSSRSSSTPPSPRRITRRPTPGDSSSWPGRPAATVGEAHARAVARAREGLTPEGRAKEAALLERAPVVIACCLVPGEDPVRAREDRDAVAAAIAEPPPGRARAGPRRDLAHRDDGRRAGGVRGARARRGRCHRRPRLPGPPVARRGGPCPGASRGGCLHAVARLVGADRRAGGAPIGARPHAGPQAGRSGAFSSPEIERLASPP